ncbi:MAG: sugar ABC transporter ATP-binding protein [Devosia nanyangense]|uniref:Sugar ABC transporter ATP-binding protein n=1 Tax=Devosia nanyangense TaxID=1228055 RepID=A0A933NZE9_9HYPH|nr:sugar ABC transporter ATP-binding protein [Devosia nanyangense]
MDIGAGVPFIDTRDLGKRYGGLHAVRDVSLSIYAGEVMAIVGDNGAGKSTFIKMLAGDHAPTSGEIIVDGRKVEFKHPRDAKAAGIATIYQDLALCENLNVTDNIFLGNELTKNPLLRLLQSRKMHDEARALLDELGIGIPSTRELVVNMSGGQRQATTLARVAKAGARLLILDEPSAALGVRETRALLDLILRFRGQGKAILIISHEMRDVFEITDRIAVFKRGALIAVRRTKETTPDEIVSLIIKGNS